jgi:hypothetical protein
MAAMPLTFCDNAHALEVDAVRFVSSDVVGEYRKGFGGVCKN